MATAKRILTVIVYSLIFVLFQAPVGFAQESSSSSDESSVSSEYEVTDEEATPPPPEEVTTEKSNSSKKSNDESFKVTAPESAVMSLAGGGTSALAGGGVYSNPEAINVSQTGAASFSYPISVPPGRNGLQPNITLQYNSYSENGWLGVGWNLDFGSINRSRRNGLNYSGTDFMVNGSDLVANTNWGANYYCEKIEGTFTKYYYNSSSNYWIATAKDGTIYRYGYSTSSRMASGTNTYSWHLDRVEDTNGNYMTISYTTVSNQIYPYQISYTGKTGGLSPNKIVEFDLETRTDNLYSYKTKYLVTTTRRLKTITVQVGSTTVYKYILNYENIAGTNGSSRLIQIKRVDPTNQNNSLPATEFTYINGGNGTFDSSSILSLNGSTGGTIVFGDINGDGREDFIKSYSSGTNPTVTVYPYLANSSGGFTAQTSKTLEKCPTGAMSVKLGDINGDGKADIVSNGLSGAVHAYLSNGNGTFSSKYTTTGATGITSIYLAELNGDGKADLVKYNSTTCIVYTALSNGNGLFGTQNTVSLKYYDIQDNTNFLLADVNGDGKADLYNRFHWGVLSVPPAEAYTQIIRLGNGNGTFGSHYYEFTLPTNPGQPQNWIGQETLSDINGDGLADLASIYYTGTANLWISFSTGTGMADVNTNITNISSFQFEDINDDGMTDLVTSSSTINYFYKSNGNGTFASPVNAGGPTGTGYYYALLADIDGDGRPDMIKHNSTGNSISYSLASGQDAGDQIETIINPLNGQTDIEYGNNIDIPNSKIPFAIHPVTHIYAYDGINPTAAHTAYNYTGAYYEYDERDFRAYSKVKQTNYILDQNNQEIIESTVETTYEQLDDYKKGRPLQLDMKNSGGALLKRATFTWAADAISGTTAKFVKLTNKRTDIYGTTNVYTNEAYTYNSTYGGVLTTVTSGSGGAESITLTNTYINKGTWIWRKASEKITGSSSPSTTIRQTNYTYDSLGNLLTKTYVNTSGTSPVETYTYDTYGNVVTRVDPKNYTTSYTYDTATYTFATYITYPSTGVTHSIRMGYHPDFEKIEYEIDENGNETEYVYDAYGRVTQIIYPGGGHTVYEYNDYSDPVFVKTSVLEQPGVYVDTWQYVDGFGRTIMAVSKGVGSNYVVSRQFFDKMGRNYYSYGPYFSNTSAYNHTPPATFPTSSRTYDSMGRVIGVFTPLYGGTLNQFNTTAITYNGFNTTITDAKGNIRVEETDYLGRIIRVQEDTGGGTTYYAYNPAGDLTSVTDAAGNVTTINYNTLGQKMNMTDPDMGTWYYTYDLNGNLYQQTDALGQTITFSYDALNRVTLKDYSTSDPDITYAYDNTASGANGKGRLYFVTNWIDDFTTYNSYDSMGRVLSVTKTITGDNQARTTLYTYDKAGKLLTTQYPGTDNFIVTNTYHTGSNLLSAVTGSDGVSYASISEYSPSGKMKILSHGNNTSTTYSYDARSEKLSQVYTTSNVSGTLQTLQQKIYYYTGIGEISAILDLSVQGYLAYNYDKIGRLTNETLMGTTTGTYAYNAIGNITSKTVGGNTFTYSYSANHKHAVSGITYNGTTYSYSYDANGNMTYGADFTNLGNIQARTIIYNADNMPTQISHSSNITTQLTYGGTGERVKKRVYSGGNVTDTYYIGDHFEVKGGETIKYIFAGNLRVAQVKGTTRSFFHKDHLGSSTVMTDASGYVIESTAYMPFGSQRSHTGTSTSDYKYTDQELDAENGLYNYNARLYDPFIGRFISPDTIVQAPYNPQSLNRYSYCLNNPLIYVDPSGHVSEEDLLKAGYTYDKETGDWLMPGIEVSTPRLYMCGNGWGGIAYLTSEQIIGSWGAWYPIEPVPAFPEINNEYQQRLDKYLRYLDELRGGSNSVYAVNAGTVSSVGWESDKDHNKGYGWYIEIKGDDGSKDFYAHMDPGTTPKKDTLINVSDYVGRIADPTNGKSTKPHLHYGHMDANGKWVDPLTINANPMPNGKITSPFGPRIDPVTHEKGKEHKGIDIIPK